jgi:translation initiation factor IF-2
MDKIRLYELAKQLNTNSKTLSEKLKAIKIDVKNHMSIIEDNDLKAIYKYFGVNIKDENAAAAPAPEVKEQPQQKPKEEDQKEQGKGDEKPLKSAKPKKEAPRIIRTQVTEIRTDANTGIVTEIRTEIQGDHRKETRTNIKLDAPKQEKPDLFDIRPRPKFEPSVKTAAPVSHAANTVVAEEKVEKTPEIVQEKQEVKTQVKPDVVSEKPAYTPRPQGDRPYTPRQQGDRPYTPRPQGDRPYTPRQQGDRPYTPRPQGDRPYTPRPQGYNNQNRPNNFNRNNTGAPSNGQNRPYTPGNRPDNRFNNNTSGSRPPYAGQKQPDLQSADVLKPAIGRQPHRDTNLDKQKMNDPKRDINRNNKFAPKQNRGNNRNTTYNPLVTSEHKVNDILNNDEIFLGFYDDDNKRVKKQKNKKGTMNALGQMEPVKVVLKVILPEIITVKDFAERMKKQSGEIIKKLFNYGVMATLNQEIDFDTASTIAEEFGYTVEREVVVSEEDILFDDSTDIESELEPRAPVVVVMGHVDHGKTSLLDAIRETNVIEREAGGITQHIGAYSVKINNRKITFLDTPGHAAFTAMRARGAQVTDIAILVVAADDGVMPQTVEAINHAKAAGIPIIVAINKIDKEGSDPERVKRELMEHELVAEEWGGDTIFANVSAKKRIGIDSLLEMVLLVADIKELKANPNKQAKGTIIEAKLDKGRGPVATVLVQRGTLMVGDSIVTGTTVGRIRAMTDDKGQKVKKAKPSTPVEIIGLTDVPEAGEVFYAIKDEKVAKSLVEKRKHKQRELSLKASSKITLDDLFSQIQQGKVKDLNIIVKADVQGSVEAVKQSLEKLSNEEVRVKIIHGAVGAITESDVMLANVSNAIIIGFNVRPEANGRAMAERENVDVRLYRVIYEAIEDISSAMKGMLEPKFKEVILGHAEIRQIFKASDIGTIAGSYITDGKVTRNSNARVLRDSIVVFEGKIISLKRFKEDAKEVAAGYECGISIEKFIDYKVGDVIEAYIDEKIEA